jgi:antagonist of KipI
MSIKIIKKGLSDSIQDNGRYGYQHLGIQPSGCMDYLSAWLANKILGNQLNNPVFELHFPSSQLLFENNYTICITGANFVPLINEKSVELNTPIQVYKNDVLSMLQPIEGRTCYVAINGNLNSKLWLGSHSYSKQTLEKDNQLNFSEINLQNDNSPYLIKSLIQDIKRF